MNQLVNCSFLGLLPDFLAGQLSDQDHQLVLRHVENCPSCHHQLEIDNFPEVKAEDQTPIRASRLLRYLPGAGSSPTPNSQESSPHPLAGLKEKTVPLGKSTPAKPDAKTHLDQYELLEVIGRGGMGIVFKGRDTLLDRIVAIKVLGLVLDNDPEGRLRFIREARSAAAVHHEHVVTVFDFGGQDSEPYLVMEFVEGISLHDYLMQTGPLPVPEIITLAIQIAEGLAAAHARGLVHRDIKPGNILLQKPNERIKITDFGLARALDGSKLSRSGTICGTAHYMAPEQALGKEVDARADLFSFGIVLYQMCTGQLPFDAPQTMAVLRKVCEEEPKPVQEIIGTIPDWLAQLISRLLAKNPEDRPAKASEVADVLRSQRVLPENTREICKPNGKFATESKRNDQVNKLVISTLALLVFLIAMPIFYLLAVSSPEVEKGADREEDNKQKESALTSAGLNKSNPREGPQKNKAQNVDSPQGKIPTAPKQIPQKNAQKKNRPVPPPQREGIVQVESTDEIGAFFLKNEGMTFRHVKSGQQIRLKEGRYRIPAGDYEFSMAFVPPGLQISSKNFSILPNESITIEVHHQHPKESPFPGPQGQGRPNTNFPPPGFGGPPPPFDLRRGFERRP